MTTLAEIAGWKIKKGQQSRFDIYISDDNKKGKVEFDKDEIAFISKHPSGEKHGITIEIGNVLLEINHETQTILFRQPYHSNPDSVEEDYT